ncbi:hypothetical protein NPIL_416701 [Nephila pilipes]|uniref:Uncharacterized protein n=1 Tax=Nephila pilipes TaxID=299642 RepID=A0A8X6P0R8_NEPPI|nr:hypothetical protein NPIL_416701 [Nephila pilipes]
MVLLDGAQATFGCAAGKPERFVIVSELFMLVFKAFIDLLILCTSSIDVAFFNHVATLYYAVFHSVIEFWISASSETLRKMGTIASFSISCCSL